MLISNWIITDPQGRALVNPADSFDLGATGLREVLQNVRVILTTRIGSVMLDRRFGLDMNFVDAPQNIAHTMVVQSLCVALSRFEPRVTFKGVRFDIDTATLAMDAYLAILINPIELAEYYV